MLFRTVLSFESVASVRDIRRTYFIAEPYKLYSAIYQCCSEEVSAAAASLDMYVRSLPPSTTPICSKYREQISVEIVLLASMWCKDLGILYAKWETTSVEINDKINLGDIVQRGYRTRLFSKHRFIWNISTRNLKYNLNSFRSRRFLIQTKLLIVLGSFLYCFSRSLCRSDALVALKILERRNWKKYFHVLHSILHSLQCFRLNSIFQYETITNESQTKNVRNLWWLYRM